MSETQNKDQETTLIEMTAEELCSLPLEEWVRHSAFIEVMDASFFKAILKNEPASSSLLLDVASAFERGDSIRTVRGHDVLADTISPLFRDWLDSRRPDAERILWLPQNKVTEHTVVLPENTDKTTRPDSEEELVPTRIPYFIRSSILPDEEKKFLIKTLDEFINNNLEEGYPPPLLKNCERLGQRLGFSKEECSILMFAAYLKFSRECSGFSRFATASRVKSASEFSTMAAHITEVKKEDLLAFTKPSSRLFKSGLLTMYPDDGMPIIKLGEGNPDLLLYDFYPSITAYHLLLPYKVDMDDVLVRLVGDIEKPELTLRSFQHLSKPIKHAAAVLKRALKRKEKGVNLVVYGDTGYGKTEIAKLVAELSGATLFSVSDNLPGNNSAQNPLNRFRMLSYAQSVFAGDS